MNNTDMNFRGKDDSGEWVEFSLKERLVHALVKPPFLRGTGLMVKKETETEGEEEAELFEGDIVEIDIARSNPWVVHWEPRICSFQFVPFKFHTGCMNILESARKRYKIIGNIYDIEEEHRI